MDEIQLYLPLILHIVGIVLGLVLTWAAAKAAKNWGINIEAKDREALHMAIMTALRAVLATRTTTAGAVVGGVVAGMATKEVLREVKEHVGKSVPDAVRRTKVLTKPEDVFRRIVDSKVPLVLNELGAKPTNR